MHIEDNLLTPGQESAGTYLRAVCAPSGLGNALHRDGPQRRDRGV